MAVHKLLACDETASLGLPLAHFEATICLLCKIVIKQTYVHFRLAFL